MTKIVDNPIELGLDNSENQHFYAKVVLSDINGNSIEFPPRNIIYMVIREWVFADSFIPRIELIIHDDGTYTDIIVPNFN